MDRYIKVTFNIRAKLVTFDIYTNPQKNNLLTEKAI